jgi:YgiT-type zinc finger domain-containing protein
MTCAICGVGSTEMGETTVTLERGSTTIVFKGVPAQVCDNCGEAYLDEAIAKSLLVAAESAARDGVQVDVRKYAA